MSVGGVQSEGTTCVSGASPSGPEDSWNAAVSLNGNQDLDQGTWTKTITKPPKLIYMHLRILQFLQVTDIWLWKELQSCQHTYFWRLRHYNFFCVKSPLNLNVLTIFKENILSFNPATSRAQGYFHYSWWKRSSPEAAVLSQQGACDGYVDLHFRGDWLQKVVGGKLSLIVRCIPGKSKRILKSFYFTE